MQLFKGVREVKKQTFSRSKGEKKAFFPPCPDGVNALLCSLPSKSYKDEALNRSAKVHHLGRDATRKQPKNYSAGHWEG